MNKTSSDNYDDTNKTFKLGVFNIPIHFKNMYEKAKKSKATALKLKCIECQCWQRNQVPLCTIQECPLWLHRPGVKRPKNPNRKITNPNPNFGRKKKPPEPDSTPKTH